MTPSDYVQTVQHAVMACPLHCFTRSTFAPEDEKKSFRMLPYACRPFLGWPGPHERAGYIVYSTWDGLAPSTWRHGSMLVDVL